MTSGEARRPRVGTREILALMLLLAVLAGGWFIVDRQRQGQEQQLEAIDLSVQCSIANGQVVSRGGVNICVDAVGHEIDLPRR
jgi:hypothetical protein